MIVLLGGSGYVGTAFCKALKADGREVLSLSRAETDYANLSVLTALLQEKKPEFLINAAGYSGKPNVDACEDNKSDCLNGNAVLPGTIRAACEATGTRWGHVSSGCIFTGQNDDGSPFCEGDPPNFCFRTDNCSFYSGTKALGEEVLEGAKECYIWRLRIPFNHIDGKRNYLTKLLRYQTLLEATNSLSHLGEFVRAGIDCFDKQVPFGVYNLTNTGSVTTREVVKLIEDSGVAGDKQFQFFESEEQFMQIAAKTPRSNCTMDNSKALAAGLSLSCVQDAIRDSLANWMPEETA
jgi:dTDP-4-dehydrorhamnose reductase